VDPDGRPSVASGRFTGGPSISSPMRCPSVACGMPGRMQSTTQSGTQNFAVDHMTP
jgi:hypothetical protein